MSPTLRVGILSGVANLGLGDLIQKNYLYYVVRRSFPGAEITLFEQRRIVRKHPDFYARHCYVDRVVEVPPDLAAEGPQRRSALARRRLDWCIVDPFSVVFTPGDARLMEAPRCVSMPSGANWQWSQQQSEAITHPIVLSVAEPRSPDLLDFYASLDVAINGARTVSSESQLPPFRFAADPAVLPGVGKRWVALHAGCAANWNRRWPLSAYAELGTRIAAEFDVGLILLGGAEERERDANLRDAIAARHAGVAIVSLSGANVNELANAVAGSDLLVGNDSAMMHLAAALRRPSVCLYGPSQALLYLWERFYTEQQALTGPCECDKDVLTSPCRRMRRTEFAGSQEEYPHCLATLGIDRVWPAVRARLVEIHQQAQVT